MSEVLQNAGSSPTGKLNLGGLAGIGGVRAADKLSANDVILMCAKR